MSGDESVDGHETIRLGDCLVEPDRLCVTRDGARQKLEPMAMRVIVYLATRPDQVVSRAEILEQVWEGRAVVDETLSRAVSLVRRALGDNAQNPTYIETIPKRGYRLIAAVERVETVEPVQPGSRSESDERDRPDGSRAGMLRAPLVLGLALAALVVVGLAIDVGRAGGPSATERDVSAGVADPTASLSPAAAPKAATAAFEDRPGIAVLPFENLSPDSENAYLAEGLTDELIHQLAEFSGLRVVSRRSSSRFRDTASTNPEIARALDVDYLLTGTVLVSDGRLRIGARLIRPDRDDHLLSRSYDRTLSEVLDLQREVAKDVAEHTRTTLKTAEALRLTQQRAVRVEAYRAYLRGQQQVQHRNDVGRGIELLEEAVVLDPAFGRAWAALANAFLLSSAYTGRSEVDAYAAADRAIGRALDLDPDLSAAHTAQGLLRFQRDRDWSGAEASYQRAIALEPSHVTAHQWYSELLSLAGRHEEALARIAVALDLDPLSPLVHAAAGQRLNNAGRYADALRRFQDSEALGADFRWHLREKVWSLYRLGRKEEALATRVEATKLRPGLSAERRAALDRAVAERGFEGYFRWDLENLLTLEPPRPGYSTWLAAAYSGIGDTEKALVALAQAAEQRSLWLLHTLKSPAFDAIRDDPRFDVALGDLPAWKPAPVVRDE